MPPWWNQQENVYDLQEFREDGAEAQPPAAFQHHTQHKHQGFFSFLIKHQSTLNCSFICETIYHNDNTRISGFLFVFLRWMLAVAMLEAQTVTFQNPHKMKNPAETLLLL